MISVFPRQWGLDFLRTLELAWILFGAWGAGQLLLRRRLPGGLTATERILIPVGLGLGALSLSVLAFGFAGLLRPLPLTLLLAAFTAMALAAFLTSRHEAGRLLFAMPGDGARGLLLLAVCGALLSWITALAPPMFYDALVYHLGIPNLFLLRGGVEHIPRVVYANFPLGTEMLYIIGLFLGGPELAGLINWAFGILAAIALAAILLPRWGSRAAAAAAALFLFTPQEMTISRYVTVESAMTFFTLLAFLGLFRYRESEATVWMALAGIFGGLAFSTKYVGGIFAVALPALALLFTRRPKAAMLFIAAATAVASPWFVKNIAFTGNPVYPALTGFFGGSDWSPAQAAALAKNANASWATANSFWDWIRLPVDLILWRRDFGAAAAGGWIWAPLWTAAVALAVSGKNLSERLLLTLFASCLALWAATFWMARFLLPALALGTAIAAVVLERLAARWKIFHPGLVVSAVVVVCLATFFSAGPTRLVFAPALGFQSPNEYLRRQIRIYPTVEFANRELPAAARILLLGDARASYLRRDHIYATVLDRPILPDIFASGADPVAIAAGLRRAGVTHVLLNLFDLERTARRYPASRTPAEFLDPFLRFLAGWCRLLGSGNGVFLFEVPSRLSPEAPGAP